jgi:hypothetical protein
MGWYRGLIWHNNASICRNLDTFINAWRELGRYPLAAP